MRKTANIKADKNNSAAVIYSYFEKGLSEEMRTRQSRKVIWDMINTLFVTTEAVEPTFVAFL